MTELAEIFGNNFLLLDYRGQFTLKCHILCQKEMSELERDFVG